MPSAAPRLDDLLTALPDDPAASEQLALLPEGTSKRVVEGQAGGDFPAAPAAAPAPREPGKAGRPPGSQNRFSRDLVRIVTAKLGRHPLEEVVRLYRAPRAELVETFGQGVKESELRERLLFKLVDATTPKMPVQVNVDKSETVTVVLGDLAGGAQGQIASDAVLDLPFNEINGLDEGEA